MSQYPYQPPNAPYGYGSYPQDPLGALLAPAKRASVFLFIMGGLMIPCGLLFGMASLMDFSQFASDPNFQQLEKQFATVGWSLQGLFKVMAAFILVPGILFVVFGVTVRRGGMGSIVGSIILCCLMALFAVLAIFGGIVQAGQGGAQALLGIVIWIGVLIFLIATLVSLFKAASNSGAVNNFRMGYHPNLQQNPQYPPNYQPQSPSQQPQSFQQPPNQWGQPSWPPQPQPPQQQQQNWPPPPSNPT